MILDRILDHKKGELRHKKSRGYLTQLKRSIRDRAAPLGFVQALKRGWTTTAPALIAEVKKASPSQGLMRPEFADHFDPVHIARAYTDHGATAISVLTDQDFFQGSLDYLRAIKEQVGLPVLNKEFIIDELQCFEARASGADCILLIVAALDRFQLVDLFAAAKGMELDVLIETHHEREVDLVLERLPTAIFIGINNRDLQTFKADLGITQRLAKRIPQDKLIVSESGIHRRDDVLRLQEAGARAMLVGESLIKAPDIGEKIRELLGTRKSLEQDENQGARWI